MISNKGFLIAIVVFVLFCFCFSAVLNPESQTHTRQGLSHWNTSPTHDGYLLGTYWLPAHFSLVNHLSIFHIYSSWMVCFNVELWEFFITIYTNSLFDILFAFFSFRVFLPLHSLNKHVYLLGFNFQQKLEWPTEVISMTWCRKVVYKLYSWTLSIRSGASYSLKTEWLDVNIEEKVRGRQ